MGCERLHALDDVDEHSWTCSLLDMLLLPTVALVPRKIASAVHTWGYTCGSPWASC